LQAQRRMRGASESSVTQGEPLMPLPCVGSGSMIPFKQWILLLFLGGEGGHNITNPSLQLEMKPIIYIMSGVLTVK